MQNLKKIISSFGYAAQGISYAWKNELNFRVELVLGIIAILISIYLRISVTPIVLISALVLGLELMNTALEALIDLVSPEYSKLAKIAKDCAAAAVMTAAIFAIIIALSHILPAILLKLNII